MVGVTFARVIKIAEEEIHRAPRAAYATGQDPALALVTLKVRTSSLSFSAELVARTNSPPGETARHAGASSYGVA